MNKNLGAGFCTVILVIVSFIFFAQCTNAQVLGIPVPQIGKGEWDNVLAAFPEKSPIALLAWGKAGQPNPTGNPSEKWLARKELQETCGKLKQVIVQLANQSNNETLAAWVNGPIWEILKNGGMVALENADIENRTFAASFISYQYEAVSIKELLAKFDKHDFQETKIGEDVVYGSRLGRDDSVAKNDITVGFHGQYLIVASNIAHWGQIAKRIDAGQRAPKWTTKLFEKYPIRRMGACAFCNLAKIKDLVSSSGDQSAAQARKILDQLGVEFVFATHGTDAISNVCMVHVEGAQSGLLSVVEVAPFKLEQIAELSADAVETCLTKVSFENIKKFVNELRPQRGEGDGLDRFEVVMGGPIKRVEDQFQIDLEKDIVDALRGDIRLSLSGALIKPRFVATVGVKDAKGFKATFDKINRKIEESAGQFEAEEFSKKTGRDGITVYGFKQRGTGGFWALHDSELFIGSNNRVIGSFVRKRGERTKPLTKHPLVAAILSDGQPKDSAGPFMVEATSWGQVIAALLPMASLGINLAPPKVRKLITVEDIPSPEALRGLRPNVSVGFKTESGVTMISRYDTPVSFQASSGTFVVGMLLPAVQQVREAARRTQR